MGTSQSPVVQRSQNSPVNLPSIDTHARVDTLLRAIGDSGADSPLALDNNNNVAQLKQPGAGDELAYKEALKAIQKKIGANETGQWDEQSQSALNAFASERGKSPMRALTGLAWDIRIERQSSRRQDTAAAYEAQTGFKAEPVRDENKEVMAAINELQHTRNGEDVRKIDLIKHRDDLQAFKGAKQEIFDKKNSADQASNQSIDDLKSKRDKLYQTILSEQAAAKASSVPTDYDKHLIAARKAKDELNLVNHAISDGSVGNNSTKKSASNYDALQKKLDKTLQVEHPEKIDGSKALGEIKSKITESIEVVTEAKRITDTRIAQLEKNTKDDRLSLSGRRFERLRIGLHKVWNAAQSLVSPTPPDSTPYSIRGEHDASLKPLYALRKHETERLQQLEELKNIVSKGEARTQDLTAKGKSSEASTINYQLRENLHNVDISYRSKINNFEKLAQTISTPLRGQKTDVNELAQLKSDANTPVLDYNAFYHASQAHNELASAAKTQHYQAEKHLVDGMVMAAETYGVGKAFKWLKVTGSAAIGKLADTTLGQKWVHASAEILRGKKLEVAKELSEKSDLLQRASRSAENIREKIPGFKSEGLKLWRTSTPYKTKLKSLDQEISTLNKDIAKLQKEFNALEKREIARRGLLKTPDIKPEAPQLSLPSAEVTRTSTGQPVVEKILDPSTDIAKTATTIRKGAGTTSAATTSAADDAVNAVDKTSKSNATTASQAGENSAAGQTKNAGSAGNTTETSANTGSGPASTGPSQSSPPTGKNLQTQAEAGTNDLPPGPG
ncbi:MAG: hypothetical protein PHC51_14695, partial [bacterium]|nr:hypothetical protein [bacterium]